MQRGTPPWREAKTQNVWDMKKENISVNARNSIIATIPIGWYSVASSVYVPVEAV